MSGLIKVLDAKEKARTLASKSKSDQEPKNEQPVTTFRIAHGLDFYLFVVFAASVTVRHFWGYDINWSYNVPQDTARTIFRTLTEAGFQAV